MAEQMFQYRVDVIVKKVSGDDADDDDAVRDAVREALESESSIFVENEGDDDTEMELTIGTIEQL